MSHKKNLKEVPGRHRIEISIRENDLKVLRRKERK